MGLTEDELQAAAARVSSSPAASVRGPAGVKDIDQAWDTLRSQVCRTLQAEPDLLYYYVFLLSNRVLKKSREICAVLEEMIFAAEGWQKDPAPPSAQQQQRLRRVYQRLESRAFVDPDELVALHQEVDSYLREELVPRLTVRGRLQVQGSEAKELYSRRKQDLLSKWLPLLHDLRRVFRGPRVDAALVREAAVRLPLANLGKTLDADHGSRAFAVQLAAAEAAVQAMGRPLLFRQRAATAHGTRPAHPPGFTLTYTCANGRVVLLRLSRPAVELGIRVGDEVRWGSQVGTVQSVEDATLGLSGDIRPTDSQVQIVPPYEAYLVALLEGVRDIYRHLPSRPELNAKLAQWEEGKLSDIRNIVEYLGTLHGYLSAVTLPITKAFTRLGIEHTQGSALEEVLRAYSPVFPRRLVKLGDKLLDTLEDAGMDYVADLLIQGNVTYLLNLPAQETSRQGRLSRATTELSFYLGDADGLG